jgi:hypothetical protein
MNMKAAFFLLVCLLAGRVMAAAPGPQRGDPQIARHVVAAGELEMAVEQTSDGLRLQSLLDVPKRQQLLSDSPSLPLFTLTMRQHDGNKEVRLNADAGWGHVKVTPSPSGGGIVIRWEKPADEAIGEVSVEAQAVPDNAASALTWRLVVQSEKANWRLWQVTFPQVAITELGDDACVFFPRGPGEVQKGVWRREFRYSGMYPNGWTSMAFQAANLD